MKKILLSFAFLGFSLVATAQQGDNMERLQQQPPRETQVELERSATRDAKKTEEQRKKKEAEAEKTKSQSLKEAEPSKVSLETVQEKKAKDKSKKK